MTTARFVVQETFDVAARAGLLVVGTVEGNVTPGTRLVDDQRREVTVLALEFLTPRNREDGTITVLLPRDSGVSLHPGAVLVARED